MKRMHLYFNDDTAKAIHQLRKELNVSSTSAMLARLVTIGIAITKLKDSNGVLTIVDTNGFNTKIIL